ncbi:MAG: ATPase [Rhodobacteraceae bacterium]|nr:ATPase [Paracoccaceae bacterium]
MLESDDMCLVGVDGGGTSCRIGLLHRGVRTEVKVGKANVSTNLGGAIHTIIQGMDSVAEKAGVSKDTLYQGNAYLGLAGVTGPEVTATVAAGLPFRNIVVEDDRISAVVGALEDQDGVVAGIGTGSFLSRQSQGKIRFIGGWGFQLADEASGAWLGRALLSRVLRVVDGIAEPTKLTKTVFAEFGNQAGGVVIFSLNASPADYAQLAPQVIDAAALGDEAAIKLMDEGARFIESGLTAIGWQPGEPLCLMGGVARHYKPYLGSDFLTSLIAPKGKALDGALALASRLGAGTERRSA